MNVVFRLRCRKPYLATTRAPLCNCQLFEQELIFRLEQIIDKKTAQYEPIKLIAVRNPYHQFGPESKSYEEYVNMDPMRHPFPSYIERAAIQGVAVIYKSEVLEFLKIFRGTLGFFRFRIGELPCYFFIYISNWMKPEDLVYPR